MRNASSSRPGHAQSSSGSVLSPTPNRGGEIQTGQKNRKTELFGGKFHCPHSLADSLSSRHKVATLTTSIRVLYIPILYTYTAPLPRNPESEELPSIAPPVFKTQAEGPRTRPNVPPQPGPGPGTGAPPPPHRGGPPRGGAGDVLLGARRRGSPGGGTAPPSPPPPPSPPGRRRRRRRRRRRPGGRPGPRRIHRPPPRRGLRPRTPRATGGRPSRPSRRTGPRRCPRCCSGSCGSGSWSGSGSGG